MATQPKTGIALAMQFFGRKPGQSLSDFRDEWNTLKVPGKTEADQKSVQNAIIAGIENGTLTY